MKIKPGRYLMRNGKVATITGRDATRAGTAWEVVGSVDGYVSKWCSNGRLWPLSANGWDLVKRLPDAKPAKPKAKAAGWCVITTARTRSAARRYAKTIEGLSLGRTMGECSVRKLP